MPKKKKTRAKAKPAPKRKASPKKKAARKAPPKKKAKAKAKGPAGRKGVKAREAATPPAPPTILPPPGGIELGRVEDFFAHINVIAFTLVESVKVGDRIQVLGHTTHIEQAVESMQIDHQPVTSAAPGQAVGIKVTDRARKGDHVFRVPI